MKKQERGGMMMQKNRMEYEHVLHHQPKRKKRFRRVGRFFRGYLMAVGALTTGYVLVQLIVLLLVEIAKWQIR